MPKPRAIIDTGTDDDPLAAALKRVLERERDPRARAWLAGLLEGDAPAIYPAPGKSPSGDEGEKQRRKRPRKRAA